MAIVIIFPECCIRAVIDIIHNALVLRYVT